MTHTSKNSYLKLDLYLKNTFFTSDKNISDVWQLQFFENQFNFYNQINNNYDIWNLPKINYTAEDIRS